MTMNMNMKVYRTILLVLLLTLPSIHYAHAQTCPQPFVIRQEACPGGTSTCTSKGSTLTYQELDRDLLNTIGLCDTVGRYTWPAPSAGIVKSNGSGVLSLIDSGAADFLKSGALTCGAGTQGKIQVHTTPIQYCDNSATPTLRYSAYGDNTGAALSGDSATAFFSTGQIEQARGGTNIDTSASTGIPRISSGTWTINAGISHLASSTSADLLGVLSNETGSGLSVFNASPTIVGVPVIGDGAGNDNLSFIPETTNPTCSAGAYRIWANSTDNKLKKCENGTTSDLDLNTGGGGGGAPTTSQYLTLANDAGLSEERLFTPGLGLTATDAGADSTYTLSFKTSDTLAGNPTLSAEQTVFTTDGTGGGLLFEGLTADTIEGLLSWSPTTSDRTLALPDESGTLCSTGSVCTGYGTVSSVALTVPGVLFSVSGSPITTSGTLALSLLSQTSNKIFAGPTTGSATPTWRNLVVTDLPSFTSADLAGLLSDETGSGASVMAVSPALTGTPTVPTAAADTSTTQAASTAYVQGEINGSGGRSITCTSGSCDADPETYEFTKCITIENPTSADDFLMFRLERAATITGIDCLVVGGTSVATLVKECDANGGTCGNTEASITCGTTNTTEASGIDDSAVDAGDWMRVDPGTVTGSVTQLSVCIVYQSAD